MLRHTQNTKQNSKQNTKHNLKQNIIYLTIFIVLFLGLCIYVNYVNYVKVKDTFENANSGKIAFLFLTYTNLKRPDIWTSFFDSKYSDKFTIYNHSKEPEKVTDLLLKDKHIPEHIDTCWGCPNLVEANILMMKQALLDPLNKKFILVSDSCIPIVSFDKFYSEIMKDDKSIINIHYNNNPERFDNIVNPSFKKEEFTKHSGSGLVLNIKHAKILVSELYNYRNNWKNVYVPDEHYIGNTLRVLDTDFNINYKNSKPTFDIWDKDKLKTKDEIIINPEYYALIKSISNKSIDELRSNKYVIIRKINETTEIDINYIFT